MVSELNSVHRGMSVYGRDGEYVGKVTAVRLRGHAVTRAIGHGATSTQEPTGGRSTVTEPPPAPATLGSVPAGTTTAKDRGRPNDMELLAGRDPETLNPVTQASRPGSGGADLMRGYSPRRRDMAEA